MIDEATFNMYGFLFILIIHIVFDIYRKTYYKIFIKICILFVMSVINLLSVKVHFYMVLFLGFFIYMTITFFEEYKE